MEDQQQILEECFKIFVLTGTPWKELLETTVDGEIPKSVQRKFLYNKAVEAEEKSIAQAKQAVEAREQYYLSQGLNKDGSPRD